MTIVIPSPFAGLVIPRARVLPLIYPSVRSSATYSSGSGTTTLNVPMPSPVSAGDILIMTISCRGPSARTVSTHPAGWTILCDAAGSGDHRRALCYAKVASGSEGGGTAAVVMSGGTNSAAITVSIQGSDGTFQGSTFASGSSSAPNPSSITPSWSNLKTLFVAPVSYRGNTVSAAPSGYSGKLDHAGGDDTDIAISFRQLESFVSEDPGAYTGSVSSWASGTIAIRGGTA